jgi:hypothetical protein
VGRDHGDVVVRILGGYARKQRLAFLMSKISQAGDRTPMVCAAHSSHKWVQCTFVSAPRQCTSCLEVTVIGVRRERGQSGGGAHFLQSQQSVVSQFSI